MFIIMCRVSGGVTGTNEAPMKKYDPANPKAREVQYFATREEAEEVAKKQRENRSPYSTCDFRYWVEQC